MVRYTTKGGATRTVRAVQRTNHQAIAEQAHAKQDAEKGHTRNLCSTSLALSLGVRVTEKCDWHCSSLRSTSVTIRRIITIDSLTLWNPQREANVGEDTNKQEINMILSGAVAHYDKALSKPLRSIIVLTSLGSRPDQLFFSFLRL